MVKETKITLRTRHISCFYCIAISFFVLSIVLFALSSEQTQALGNQQSRTPAIVSASIILVLSIIIIVWITYYAIGYFRLKKHEQLHHLKQQNPTLQVPTTSAVVFDNAAFAIDDHLAIDIPTNSQTSA
jgi:uncharacterized membrane protein